MADRVLFRFMTVTDYEEEEKFLSEQHKEGWKLCKYWLPGIYFFDKCVPEDVVYRLDFEQAEKSEKTEYLQLYNDYGWEYLFDVNGFSYFRKRAGSEERELEIFSDNESRIEMVERVFKRRMIPLLMVFFSCVMPQLVIQFLNWNERGDPFAKGFVIFFTILFGLYLYLFIHCGRKIRWLKRKYMKE
ncbi:MAG: DUF2812 domain-containing protein [Dorea sp.]|jgi:hypothetical protein|nr:DUF2812 domain-containing protein [Dorea sp.]